jgi:hypothetical protein
VGLENIDSYQELKKLDEEIDSTTELAALKPIYFRLNEIIRAFPGDFDVQVTGDQIKQRLVARGTLLKQQESFPPPPPPPAPPPPAPAAQPAPPPMPLLDTVPPPPAASPEPPAVTPLPLPSALFDFAPPPPPLSVFTVTPENPPQPPAPPQPAMPAAQPPTLPISFLDTVAPVAPAATQMPLPSPLFDSAPPPPPPPALAKAPETPPEPPARRPAPPRAPFKWNRAVVIAPIAGLLVALVLVFVLVHQVRKRNADIAARNAAAVQVEIATTPPGASVTVALEKSAAGGGNPATCTSACKLALAPGTYQISASLDGFEPSAGAVTVKALKPVAISLTLQPQAQSVRLLTDLDQGKVVVDDRPPVDLQEGQLVLDKVAPGTHTMKVTGQNGDASFSFEIGDARPPAVTGPVNARNMIAVLVASFGKQARVVTNAGPWKLAVNGQPQSDAGPAGTDLTGFRAGVNEIVVREGQDQRNMSESFGAAPMLTAFLKTDVNAGTLIVSTSQDGVRVFLNGKEYRRLTQDGQLRVPILGKVAVRVAKSGFQEEPAQTADVKKGAEVRLQFNLRPQPQFGSLQIHGSIAGTEVLIDQKSAGIVGPDGLFGISKIQPGDHIIEFRREQHPPKRLHRSFQAGQAVVLTGADVVFATANGTIRLARNPASAIVTYRRADETEAREVRGNQFELPAGTYVFSAKAPGFNESTTRFPLAAGETRELDFTLARERAAPAPVATNAMLLFEDAQGWTKEGDTWVHKGGGFVPFRPSPKGVLTFNVELVKSGGVFHAGQIRWCLQYMDPKNYLLYEIDPKNFRAWVIKNGQRLERVPKTPHNLGNQKTFTIQIEVTPDRLVQRVRGGEEWKVLDNFAEPGRDFTQGKFGFLTQGNDAIAISDFRFLPK